MMSSQENEFAVFGFVNKRLRAGLLVGLLSLSVTANIYLVIKIISIQGDLYEKMLQRVDTRVDTRVDSKLDPSVDKINASIERIDTAVAVADSASREILNKKVK